MLLNKISKVIFIISLLLSQNIRASKKIEKDLEIPEYFGYAKISLGGSYFEDFKKSTINNRLTMLTGIGIGYKPSEHLRFDFNIEKHFFTKPYDSSPEKNLREIKTNHTIIIPKIYYTVFDYGYGNSLFVFGGFGIARNQLKYKLLVEKDVQKQIQTTLPDRTIQTTTQTVKEKVEELVDHKISLKPTYEAGVGIAVRIDDWRVIDFSYSYRNLGKFKDSPIKPKSHNVMSSIRFLF